MPNGTRSQLELMVRAGYPLETCGLLVGQTRQDGVQVSQVIQARNLNEERAHDRYELDPGDFLLTDERARASGLEIVGVWHSHPDHPARPSETDRAAAWEGWSYVIVSVTPDGIADVRAWRLNGSQFVEESIEPCRL
ncbi:MAG: M67 family metallopeptidase [Acidiferrobacterales bacterium]|nr:M67 family metallopeptidase [Acidiferrobacterales bacterium]